MDNVFNYEKAKMLEKIFKKHTRKNYIKCNIFNFIVFCSTNHLFNNISINNLLKEEKNGRSNNK